MSRRATKNKKRRSKRNYWWRKITLCWWFTGKGSLFHSSHKNSKNEMRIILRVLKLQNVGFWGLWVWLSVFVLLHMSVIWIHAAALRPLGSYNTRFRSDRPYNFAREARAVSPCRVPRWSINGGPALYSLSDGPINRWMHHLTFTYYSPSNSSSSSSLSIYPTITWE